VWGQSDVIYTTGFLASLLYIQEGRAVPALIAFGISCSLKPQAIFLSPLIAGLFFRGCLPWKWLWIPGAVYIATGIPQMFAGRPILKVLGHWGQVTSYKGLTHGTVANWYQWSGNSPYAVLWWTGVILAVCTTALFVLFMKNGPKEPEDWSRWLVSLSLLSTLIVPFLLPGMHERYFFPADILSIIYASYQRGGWRVILLMQAVSVFSYFPYLFKQEPVPAAWLPVGVLVAISMVVTNLIRLKTAEFRFLRGAEGLTKL